VVTHRLISSGSAFGEQIGYSRVVVDGDDIFVSGTARPAAAISLPGRNPRRRVSRSQ
jgi:hypothetical protein